MRRIVFAALGLVLAPALAWASGGRIAFDRPETQTQGRLQVTSSAFAPNGAIPQTYALSGKNISLPIAWKGAPAGTKSYALIIEDPDAPGASPTVHWVAYNIPASVSSLSRGERNVAEPKSPEGMMQGPNYHGSVGYTGPNPPSGDHPHHYHVQVFALNARLGLRPEADRDAVVKAMRGHVVAKGDLVGLYQEPPKAR